MTTITLPHSQPEARARFYGDVEDLVNPGFLSHTLSLGGKRFAVRSLGPGDLFLLRMRSDGLSDIEWKTWAVASSIWMVDGHNLLGERHAASLIHNTLRKMPSRITESLFYVVLGLFARQSKAAEAVEAFVYEDSSRTMWKLLGQDYTKHAGVLGTDTLGSNYIQRIWMAFNEVEDLRFTYDRQWEGFKLVASAQAPKGIRKIDQREEKAKQEEKARRQAIMDRYYYYRLGFIDREDFLKDKQRDVRGLSVGAKSVDALEKEFTMWVAGEMDEHDRIVSNYKETLMARKEQADMEREERLYALREEAAKIEESVDPLPLVAYTPAQLSEILKTRQPGRPGLRVVGDSDAEKRKSFVADFASRKQVAGKLVVDEDRVIDPRANPEQDKLLLQQLIQNRRVPLSSVPEDEENIDPSVFGGR